MESQGDRYSGTTNTLFQTLLSAFSRTQMLRIPLSRPTTMATFWFLTKEGKNLIAVALGFSSGSSECRFPSLELSPFSIPYQTLILFYFSLEAVANSESSWFQQIPKSILL